MKRLLLTTALAGLVVFGQNLTPEQKEADFRYMVSQFTTYYAPLDWKKQFLHFDALDLKPWLDRLAQTKTDLEYYDLCIDYVASLQDTHVSYSLPSSFTARLGLAVDIYDGKVLIETIDRSLLPARTYPFVAGDELVSVDGTPVDDLITQYMKYAPMGNLRASQRLAAARIVTRPQSRMPFASMAGDSAEVVVRRQNGDVQAYTINWTKTGVPLEVGPVPNVPLSVTKQPRKAADLSQSKDDVEQLQFSGPVGTAEELAVMGWGGRTPVYVNGLGPNFTHRLGGQTADFFYSGVFRHDDLRVGFLRVPSFSPASTQAALQQLDTEIAYFQANTDGLIIDIARNPGGDGCFAENIMQRLATDRFQTTGWEVRAFWGRTLDFYNLWINAVATNRSLEVIQQYELLYKAMKAAYESNRGVTDPIPLCTSSLERDTARNAAGASIAYTKPVMMLIDEFSASAADSLAAMFQENNRGVLFGYRTNGAGGNNTTFDSGAFTEGTLGMTIALQVKKTPVLRDGYPYTGVIENVGVHPDVIEDYMTRENLMNGGATYVQHFLWGAAAYIRQQR